MELDISALEKAFYKLKEGYERYANDESDEQIRDGLIQRFEFTYELSHKMLKRYLQMTSATPEQFENESFQFLIRSANEKSLILGNWNDWRRYREMRSKTSHTYDQKVALQVVEGIPEFIKETEGLINNLNERLS